MNANWSPPRPLRKLAGNSRSVGAQRRPPGSSGCEQHPDEGCQNLRSICGHLCHLRMNSGGESTDDADSRRDWPKRLQQRARRNVKKPRRQDFQAQERNAEPPAGVASGVPPPSLSAWSILNPLMSGWEMRSNRIRIRRGKEAQPYSGLGISGNVGCAFQVLRTFVLLVPLLFRMS